MRYNANLDKMYFKSIYPKCLINSIKLNWLNYNRSVEVDRRKKSDDDLTDLERVLIFEFIDLSEESISNFKHWTARSALK